MGASKKSGTTQQYDKHPFQLSLEEVTSHLGGIDLDQGLNSTQVNELRTKYGENKLEGDGGVRWYQVLFKQISNAMILVSSICPRHAV